jgi:hypothetical protein
MYTNTSTWTALFQQFFPIFTAPGAAIFTRLMTGWVLCTMRRTVTGMIRLPIRGLSGSRRLSWFLPDGRWI